MAVLKPQKALEVNGQEIYPLTHADQVIMPDGGRLSELPLKTWDYIDVSADIGASSAEIRLGRFGKMVTVSFFGGNMTVPADGKLRIANIAQYAGKPIFKVNSCAYLYDPELLSYPTIPAFFFLNPDGELWLYTNGKPYKYNTVRGSLTYLTTDPIPAENIEGAT